MAKKFEKSLWWVKRDFRLVDNQAFSQALTESDEVLPCFSYEPLLLQGPDWGLFHTYGLWQAQISLRKNLQNFGCDLYVSTKDIIATFEAIHSFYNFTAVYAHEETGLQHTFDRDLQVAAWCKEKGIAFIEVRNNGVVRTLKSRDVWQASFKTYIQAPKAVIPKALTLSNELKNITGAISNPTKKLLGITSLSESLPLISEAAAHAMLADFLSVRSQGYSGGISGMNKAVTHSSHLSVHLAWGTISLRYVFQATEKARKEASAFSASYQWQRSLTSFKSRLYWHAHFIQKLEDEVTMEFFVQNNAFEGTLPCVEGEELQKRLTAWEQGITGFPMIDASMRYFRTYGWLNFRSRSMVASFALHALRIDWKTVMYRMAPFMIDYVPGIHVPQIQMQAGITGSNTIRVYSPMKQMKDHDPEAFFIKSVITELEGFSAEEIVSFEQKTLGTYPRPIIDFKQETKIMKDSLYGIKKSPAGRTAAKRVYQKHGSRFRTNHTRSPRNL
jgi:deoxyribodipyrimidine photo-lyase